MEGARHDLVERGAERAALGELLAAARDGIGGVALVEGGAGLGKSRLLAECRVLASGAEVLAARGSLLEQPFVFGVLRALLGPAVRTRVPAERAALLTGAAAPAATALALDDVPGGAVQPTPALLDAIYWLVDGLCARGPLVLLVDDAHWADGPSLRALAYLAHRAEALPLALVLARRPDATETDPEAAAALAHAAGTRLTPARLSPGGIAELAAAITARPLTPDDVRVLAAVTQGNPFLVRQVTQELAAYGREGLGSGAALSPAGLRGVIGGRLAQLDPGAQEVARTLVVLGDGAHLADVAALAGLDPDAVLGHLDALIAAGLLTDDARFAFAHPLLADAVDAELTTAERARRHRAAAARLAAVGAGAERIAAHLGRSVPAGDPAAVEQLRAAARDAVRRGAPEAAVVHLRRAQAEPPSADAALAVRVELGLAELAAGHDGTAAEHLDPVLDDPAWPAQTAAAAAWACGAAGGPLGTIAALRRGAAAREAADPEGALWLTGMSGYLDYFVPLELRRPAALPPREALTGATPAERMALTAHLAGCTSAEPAVATSAAQCADMARRALGAGALAADADFQGAIFASGPILGLLYAEALDDAAAELAHVERQARAQAAAGGLSVALFPTTYALILRGDVRAAAARSESWFEITALLQGEQRSAYHAFTVALQVLAVLDHTGAADAEGVIAEHGVAGELAPDQLWLLPARAHVHLQRGRAQEALTDVLAWRAATAMVGDPLLPVEFHTVEALALARAGRAGEAVAAARRELARARAWGAPGRTSAMLRTLAELDRPRAGGLLDEALALAEQSVLPLERARVRLARGLTLRRDGARVAARAELEQAVHLAAECHAGVLVERGFAELRILGARPRRAAFAGVDALTRSERRVADLAAAGATNREIAQELFVTTKTVDSHLTRVYRKLGISGRGELPGLLGRGRAG